MTNNCCGCTPLCDEPRQLISEKCNDCDKTRDLPLPESFYTGVKLGTRIAKDKLPPFTIKVSKLPYNEKGIITVGNREIMMYEYSKQVTYIEENGVLVPHIKNKPGNPGEITIVKRGLHPSGTFAGNDGHGKDFVDKKVSDTVVKRFEADYNNCKYMYEHGVNSDITMETNHLIIRMATALTCCRPATNTDLGLVMIE